MDGIKTIINMATIDSKDAYYSVGISRQFEKFLKFKWKEKLYSFTCFPNGLGLCPREFTKLNKVPITTSHFENVPLSGYIDDFFIKGDTFLIGGGNIRKTMRLYDKLGFAINLKSPKLFRHKELKS